MAIQCQSRSPFRTKSLQCHLVIDLLRVSESISHLIRGISQMNYAHRIFAMHKISTMESYHNYLLSRGSEMWEYLTERRLRDQRIKSLMTAIYIFKIK